MPIASRSARLMSRLMGRPSSIAARPESSSPDTSQRWSTPPPIKTKIKYKLLHRRRRVDLAWPALLLFDRLVETNSEGLLEPRRTEIRFCRGPKLARLSRTALPKAGENLDLASTPAHS